MRSVLYRRGSVWWPDFKTSPAKSASTVLGSKDSDEIGSKRLLDRFFLHFSRLLPVVPRGLTPFQPITDAVSTSSPFQPIPDTISVSPSVSINC